MKQLLIMATMLLTFGLATAQTKIYTAEGNYKGKLKYIIEGAKIYYAEGNYKGKLAFLSEGDKLFYAEGNYKGKLATIFEGDKIFNAEGNSYTCFGQKMFSGFSPASPPPLTMVSLYGVRRG